MCAITGTPPWLSSWICAAISWPPSSLTAWAPALLHEPHGRVVGLLRRALVGTEGQVADDQRATYRPGDGTREGKQLVDRDGERGLVAVDVVRRTVADEQHLDAGLVEDLRGVHVVRGQHREALTALLHLAQVLGTDPLARRRRLLRTRPVGSSLLESCARLPDRAGRKRRDRRRDRQARRAGLGPCGCRSFGARSRGAAHLP